MIARHWQHLLLLCAAAFPNAGALAQPAPGLSEIIVSGSGEVRVAPTRARLTIHVRRTAPTAAAAGAEAARASKAVTSALAAAGLAGDGITETSVSVAPHTDDNDAHRRRTGFDATATLHVETTNLDRVGPLIDAALAAGVTDVDDAEFVIDDPQAARQQALALAVAATRRDGQTLARAAGGGLGELLVLSTIGLGDAMPAALVEAPDYRPPPTDVVHSTVVPGLISVTAHVTARYAFLAPAR